MGGGGRWLCHLAALVPSVTRVRGNAPYSQAEVGAEPRPSSEAVAAAAYCSNRARLAAIPRLRCRLRDIPR
jgi:hypothetical protein